jgi:hypothetical protein
MSHVHQAVILRRFEPFRDTSLNDSHMLIILKSYCIHDRLTTLTIFEWILNGCHIDLF